MRTSSLSAYRVSLLHEVATSVSEKGPRDLNRLLATFGVHSVAPYQAATF